MIQVQVLRTQMSTEVNFTKKQILSFLWPYLSVGIILLIIILSLWNKPTEIERASAIIAVFSLIFALVIERAKTERRELKIKKEISVYKRNLLFKLSGVVGAVQWATSTYITYGVNVSTLPTFMINYLTLDNFRRIQFDSHKINYDDVRFFSTSNVVPMEIKEKLDLINLDGEKLISLLPIQTGMLNRGIFIRYNQKILDIIRWSLENDESGELITTARNLISMVELLMDVTTYPKFKGFI